MPYVEVEIFTGRYPFEYWFEVSYWSDEEECWCHYTEKDGGGFGLWFVLRKAHAALQDVWFELLEEQKKNE